MRNFIDELKALQDVFGFNPAEVYQGTPEWLKMRSGVISASKAENLLAKKGSATREGYMAELVAQVCTGLLPDEINAKALAWGKDNEDDAREAYSAATFEVISEVPFIYKDNNLRAGCSPDGLCSNHGLELKVPFASRTFVEFACADKIKPEYIKQCQFSMWVTELERWDFANFDPRMSNCKRLHHVQIYRDDKMIQQIQDAYDLFVDDMDSMLAKLGVKFGDHW